MNARIERLLSLIKERCELTKTQAGGWTRKETYKRGNKLYWIEYTGKKVVIWTTKMPRTGDRSRVYEYKGWLP